MWLFNKNKSTNKLPTEKISYSQIDTTDNFGDNLNMKPEDWIKTNPLNTTNNDPKSVGLPPINTTNDETYSIAFSLSKLRESIEIPNDGVYCPVCHIANTQLSKLHTPCPQCNRELLKFGWD